MKTFTGTLLALSLVATVPCFAQQDIQQPSNPPVRAEDPAYYEDSRSEDEYTVDQTTEDQQLDQGLDAGNRVPANQPSQPSQAETMRQQPGSQPQQNTGPVYLDELNKQDQRRRPSAEEPRGQPGRMTTREDTTPPPETQLSFFEITPTIGGVSIKDNTAFSAGAHLSFRLIRDQGFYFEPSALISFVNGTGDRNATAYHIDGGLRWDFVIEKSPLIPFLRAAIGPTLTSDGDVVVNEAGDTLGDSYFNLFAGGGAKVLINQNIGARFDAGVTFQSTNPGLYVLGSVLLPL